MEVDVVMRAPTYVRTACRLMRPRQAATCCGRTTSIDDNYGGWGGASSVNSSGRAVGSCAAQAFVIADASGRRVVDHRLVRSWP